MTISPEKPDHGIIATEKNKLTFRCSATLATSSRGSSGSCSMFASSGRSFRRMCSRTISLRVMRGSIGVFHGVRAVRFPHVGLSASLGHRMANCSQEGALGRRDQGPFFPHRRLDLGHH